MNWIKRLFHKHKYKLIEEAKVPTTDCTDAKTSIIRTYKCECGKEKKEYLATDKLFWSGVNKKLF